MLVCYNKILLYLLKKKKTTQAHLKKGKKDLPQKE